MVSSGSSMVERSLYKRREMVRFHHGAHTVIFKGDERVSYKSTRLLVEAINREMESVRKAAMGNMALGSMNELRDLVAELAKKAERVAVEDVPEMAPADYVATMKPLVAEYHHLLSARSLIAECLCMDLRVPACVLIVIGEQDISVRAAHDPRRPDAALAVETLVAALDDVVKKMTAGASPDEQA